MQNELISDQLNLEIVSTIAAGGMGVVYEASSMELETSAKL